MSPPPAQPCPYCGDVAGPGRSCAVCGAPLPRRVAWPAARPGLRTAVVLCGVLFAASGTWLVACGVAMLFLVPSMVSLAMNDGGLWAAGLVIAGVALVRTAQWLLRTVASRLGGEPRIEFGEPKP